MSKHSHLLHSSHRKYLKTVITTAKAIEYLHSEGSTITVKTVSQFANISASSLYGNPTAKQLIDKFSSTNQLQ